MLELVVLVLCVVLAVVVYKKLAKRFANKGWGKFKRNVVAVPVSFIVLVIAFGFVASKFSSNGGSTASSDVAAVGSNMTGTYDCMVRFSSQAAGNPPTKWDNIAGKLIIAANTFEIDFSDPKTGKYSTIKSQRLSRNDDCDSDSVVCGKSANDMVMLASILTWDNGLSAITVLKSSVNNVLVFESIHTAHDCSKISN